MNSVDHFKLEIFVPASHLNAVKIALQDSDAGHIGNYDSCLSYSPVKGTWRSRLLFELNGGRICEQHKIYCNSIFRRYPDK